MRPVSVLLVAATGAICGGLAFAATEIGTRVGATPLLITPAPAVLFLVITAFLLWAGVHVRRYRANKDTWIDAIGAMRVAVFARASAIVGSALAGVLIGVMIVSLTQLEASAMVANAIASGLSGLVGLVWIVVALVVERWCVINPDDDGSSSSHKRSAAA